MGVDYKSEKNIGYRVSILSSSSFNKDIGKMTSIIFFALENEIQLFWTIFKITLR